MSVWQIVDMRCGRSAAAAAVATLTQYRRPTIAVGVSVAVSFRSIVGCIDRATGRFCMRAPAACAWISAGGERRVHNPVICLSFCSVDRNDSTVRPRFRTGGRVGGGRLCCSYIQHAYPWQRTGVVGVAGRYRLMRVSTKRGK